MNELLEEINGKIAELQRSFSIQPNGEVAKQLEEIAFPQEMSEYAREIYTMLAKMSQNKEKMSCE